MDCNHFCKDALKQIEIVWTCAKEDNCEEKITIDYKKSRDRPKKKWEAQIRNDISELHLSKDLTRYKLVEHVKFVSQTIGSYLFHDYCCVFIIFYLYFFGLFLVFIVVLPCLACLSCLQRVMYHFVGLFTACNNLITFDKGMVCNPPPLLKL